MSCVLPPDPSENMLSLWIKLSFAPLSGMYRQGPDIVIIWVVL